MTYNLKFIAKVIQFLCENFDLNNNLTRGATNFDLLVPSGNTCNKNSFVYDAMLDWNNLPIKIKNISKTRRLISNGVHVL
jgi:hypothetical protein